jgi:O-antigen ligase
VNSPSAALAFPQPPARRAHNIWLGIYIAVLVGKFAEWIPGLASVPLAKIAFLFTAFFAFRARGSLAPVRLRQVVIARPAVFFLSLGLLSIAFSVYKGASVAESYSVAISLFSVILLIKITQSLRDIERELFALAVAAAGLAFATLLSYGGGRAVVNGFDPNDLAYGLVTVVPLIRALAVTSKARSRGLLLNGLAGVMVVAILLTGSRGALIALAVELLAVAAFPLSFSKLGDVKRFNLLRFLFYVGVVVAVSAVVWNFLPLDIKERMATLVDLGNDYNMSSSKDGRSEIWSRDIAAVWERPIGYGLGTSEYVNGMTGGHYRAPHNSFIQALVELGFLGFVLICWSYLGAILRLGRVPRAGPKNLSVSTDGRPALYARALRMALVANLVAGFFLSHAYDSLLWILIAICAALLRVTTDSSRSSPASIAAAPTP